MSGACPGTFVPQGMELYAYRRRRGPSQNPRMFRPMVAAVLSRPANKLQLLGTLLLATGLLYALLWQANVESGGYLFRALLFGR